LFCDTNINAVIEMLDADTLYHVPIALQDQHFDDLVCEHLCLKKVEAEMSEWNAIVHKVRHLSKTIDSGLVGKYVELPDAYLSLVESFKHSGFVYDIDIKVHWINSETLETDSLHEELSHVAGIAVPGRFGLRAMDGKIEAIQYARENKVPVFEVGLGMHLA